MRILYSTHWLTAWLILALGMYILIQFSRRYTSGSAFTKTHARIVSVFTRLLEIQALVGFSLFLWSGVQGLGFPIYRIAHLVVMLIAVVLPHFSTLWRDAEDSTRFLNTIYLLLGSLLIMSLGLAVVSH